MHGEEPGEPLPVKLIQSYMAHPIFWVEIHREAYISSKASSELNTA
jgi:hypothetical protein